MQQWLTGNTEVREVMESLGSHSERESPDEKRTNGWEEPDILEEMPDSNRKFEIAEESLEEIKPPQPIVSSLKEEPVVGAGWGDDEDLLGIIDDDK